MITSQQSDKIIKALFEVKKKLKPMTKDSKNPFYRSNYLDLTDLLENLEPLLIEEDILLSQANCHRFDSEYIISRLTHVESGQFVEAEYKIDFDNDSQKQGGRSTYGRRYSLKGLLSISEKDDDGNLASGKGATKPMNTPASSTKSGFGEAKKEKAHKDSVLKAEIEAKSGGFGNKTPAIEKEESKPRVGSFGA